MERKQAVIFGDSYSTFRGYIPDGYAVYYSEEGRPETDVRAVEETWWHQVMGETGMELILNNSWSGSTICFTGYGNTDCSQTSSFLHRLQLLREQGFFRENRVDTVFVFGGTNDSWADAPVGSLKFEDWAREDLYSVLPAVCCLLKTLQDTVPGAEIFCLINTELKPEIAEGMKQACDRYGIRKIVFDHIDKQHGHPTIQGMCDIKNQVLEHLK